MNLGRDEINDYRADGGFLLEIVIHFGWKDFGAFFRQTKPLETHYQ